MENIYYKIPSFDKEDVEAIFNPNPTPHPLTTEEINEKLQKVSYAGLKFYPAKLWRNDLVRTIWTSEDGWNNPDGEIELENVEADVHNRMPNGEACDRNENSLF